MVYAYVRVSTEEQNLERQLQALEDFSKEKNIKIDRIVEEKQSGKNFSSRKGWNELNTKLTNGDVLIIKEIDRLGRNYGEMKEVWHRLSERGIAIEVIDMPLISTNFGGVKGIDGQFIADLVFNILCYLAQKEREKISTRTKEALAVKKAHGMELGRPKKKLTQEQMAELKKDLASDLSRESIMEYYGFTNRKSFYNFIRRNNKYLEFYKEGEK